MEFLENSNTLLLGKAVGPGQTGPDRDQIPGRDKASQHVTTNPFRIGLVRTYHIIYMIYNIYIYI